jgi:hypothetical protein
VVAPQVPLRGFMRWGSKAMHLSGHDTGAQAFSPARDRESG